MGADQDWASAERLLAHPAVIEVLYPGLTSFEGHETARRQMTGGFGGMLSIRVAGGEAAAIAVAAHVMLWKRATSLGGVESLIEHRASIEGEGSPAPRDLLRLSVGLEEPGDLYADLAQALERRSTPPGRCPLCNPVRTARFDRLQNLAGAARGALLLRKPFEKRPRQIPLGE